MNQKRAQEIAASPEMINVTYNGDSVYIENVNSAKDTASIHLLNHPSNSQEVHVTQLVEGK